MLVYQRVYDEDEVEDKGTHKCMATSKLNFGSSHWHGPRVPRIWTGLHFCSHETVIGCAHFPKPLERSSGRIEIHVRQLLAQMPQHNETHVCIYIDIYIIIYIHINMCTLYIRTQFCGLLWDMRDPAIQTCWSRFGTCTMLHLNLHLFPWNRIPHVQ